MWLPHGLAEGTSLPALLKLMKLCIYKDPDDWYTPCETKDLPEGATLSLRSKGRLVLSVPNLQPRQHYHLQIAGDANVSLGEGCDSVCMCVEGRAASLKPA